MDHHFQFHYQNQTLQKIENLICISMHTIEKHEKSVFEMLFIIPASQKNQYETP